MNRSQAKKAANRLDELFRSMATKQFTGDDMFIDIETPLDIIGVVDRLRTVELMLANRMKLDREAAKSLNEGLIVPDYTATPTDTTPSNNQLSRLNDTERAHFAGSTDCGPDCCEAR